MQHDSTGSGPPASRDPETAEGSSGTGRIEAFSDGVFAIAITLLVLDLNLPSLAEDASEQQFFDVFLKQWPNYLAFVVSFAFVGIMWVNHHRLFTHIARSTNILQMVNLLLLFGVTIVPFPTKLMAEALGHPSERAAALIYNGLFVAIAIFFNALWRYASKDNRLLDPNSTNASVRRITVQYAFGPILYLATFLVAFASVPLSLLFNLLLAVFFALPGPPLLRAEPS